MSSLDLEFLPRISLLAVVENGLREDTHKKRCFFSGLTTKGVGRVNPPDHKAKKHFFSINPAFLAQKIEKKKLSNSVSGYYKTKKKRKKKWNGPQSH